MGNNKDEVKWKGFINLDGDRRVFDMLKDEESDGSLYDPDNMIYRVARLSEYGTVSISHSEIVGYRVILHVQGHCKFRLQGYRCTATDQLFNIAVAKLYLAYNSGLYAELLRELHDSVDGYALEQN